MGSEAHIRIIGGPATLPARAEELLRVLEQRWTRFSASSDLSRANDGAGRPIPVAPETLTLTERLVAAWTLTGGRFDPTVDVSRLGYDRTFEAGLGGRGRIEPIPADGCDGIVVDRVASTLVVPAGVRLDPGGLGKGLAADLVADAMIDGGAVGALINVGGDVKVIGEGPEDGAWRLDITEPAIDPRPLLTVVVPGGTGLATSTPLRRRWTIGDATVHHLIDPVTGVPYDRMARLVSVLAADAWWAEASTKQIAGLVPAQAAGVLIEAAALIVDADGEHHAVNGIEAYAHE
jgi:thiamine biosynthesis lipoprotein